MVKYGFIIVPAVKFGRGGIMFCCSSGQCFLVSVKGDASAETYNDVMQFYVFCVCGNTFEMPFPVIA